MADDEGVLRRWHRRKTAAREETAPQSDLGPDLGPELVSEDAAQEAALAVPDDTVNAAEGSAGGVPDGDAAQPDLPDIDTLDAESDFSAFLGDGVPEEIQRLALRKLWRLDPVFANLDGLVDYGEDFTDANMVIEGMKTVYRVGKGLLTDEEIAEADAEIDARNKIETETEIETENRAGEPEAETVEASPEAAPDEPDGDSSEGVSADASDPTLFSDGETEGFGDSAQDSGTQSGAMDDIAKTT